MKILSLVFALLFSKTFVNAQAVKFVKENKQRFVLLLGMGLINFGMHV